MNEQWYWETKGELYGPLSTADIEGLISAKKIAYADRLKLGEKGEWLTGAEVMELVRSGADSDSSRSTAKTADDVLHDMHRRQVQRVVAGGDAETSVADSMKSVGKTVTAVKDAITDKLAAGVGLLLSTKGKYGILIACGVITTLAIVGRIDFSSAPAEYLYADLAELVGQAATLQAAEADPREWQEFANAAEPILSDIQQELKASMKGGGGAYGHVFVISELNYYIKRNLYQVAIHDLPSLLEAPDPNTMKLNPVASSQRQLNIAQPFLIQLENTPSWSVNWKVVGSNVGIPYRWMHASQPKKNNRRNQPAEEPPSGNWDWAMTGMIVADVAFVAWLVWAFRKSLMFWKAKPVRTNA